MCSLDRLTPQRFHAQVNGHGVKLLPMAQLPCVAGRDGGSLEIAAPYSWSLPWCPPKFVGGHHPGGQLDQVQGGFAGRLHNSHIENLMRPWAMGRKAWLFAVSELAGRRATVVMSLA